MILTRVVFRRADRCRLSEILGRGGRGGVRRIRIDITHQLITRAVIHETICTVGRQITSGNGRIAVLDGLGAGAVDVERGVAGRIGDSETNSHLSARLEFETGERHDLSRRTCGG